MFQSSTKSKSELEALVSEPPQYQVSELHLAVSVYVSVYVEIPQDFDFIILPHWLSSMVKPVFAPMESMKSTQFPMND